MEVDCAANKDPKELPEVCISTDGPKHIFAMISSRAINMMCK